MARKRNSTRGTSDNMREAIPENGCIDLAPDAKGTRVDCAACGLCADADSMLPVGRDGWLCRACWARISKRPMTKEG